MVYVLVAAGSATPSLEPLEPRSERLDPNLMHLVQRLTRTKFANLRIEVGWVKTLRWNNVVV